VLCLVSSWIYTAVARTLAALCVNVYTCSVSAEERRDKLRVRARALARTQTWPWMDRKKSSSSDRSISRRGNAKKSMSVQKKGSACSRQHAHALSFLLSSLFLLLVPVSYRLLTLLSPLSLFRSLFFSACRSHAPSPRLCPPLFPSHSSSDGCPARRPCPPTPPSSPRSCSTSRSSSAARR
jgi:hypothetical protein